MLVVIIAVISVLGFLLGTKFRFLTVSPTDVRFLIYFNASIHFIFMADAYKEFGLNADGFYLEIATLCLAGLLIGFGLERFLPQKDLTSASVTLSPERNKGLSIIAIAIVIAGSLANLIVYFQNTGTLNPIAGLTRYFRSGNIANEMWDTVGAERFGSDRGLVSGGSEGGSTGVLGSSLFYLLSRFAPVIYLAIGLVEKRWRFLSLIVFVTSSIIQSSAGYFSRTSILLTAGLIALYFHQNIRRFRRVESFGILGASLLLFLVLHLARMGRADSIESLAGNEAIESYRDAAAATFEPIAFAMLYYESVGVNSFKENVNHFTSYLGIFVPRVFWPTKPFYSLEPDMTMALTREDISGSNPVRTFSLAGEGLMVGGPFGVLMIAIGFSLIASYIHRYLAQREELKILQYYFTLLATCAFRTSLFTFFVGNVVLTLVPVAIVYGILLVTFGLKAKIARTNSPVQSHSARPQLLT